MFRTTSQSVLSTDRLGQTEAAGQSSSARLTVTSICLMILGTVALFALHAETASAQESKWAGQESIADNQSRKADASPMPSDSRTISISLVEAVRLALKQNPRLLAARLKALESKQTQKLYAPHFFPKPRSLWKNRRTGSIWPQ
jgi:hypothetical protein